MFVVCCSPSMSYHRLRNAHVLSAARPRRATRPVDRVGRGLRLGASDDVRVLDEETVLDDDAEHDAWSDSDLTVSATPVLLR
jgi:hypothetical protein